MAIITVTPPPELNEVAASGFAALRRAKGIPSASSEAGGGVKANLHAPLAIYHLDAKYLLDAEASTRGARHIGWKYLIEQDSSAKTVEVIGSKVAAIGQGRLATILIHTLEVAEKTVPKNRRYEARILNFGREGNSLLWLHSAKGSDKFFSLSDSPQEVSGAEALKSIAGRAQARRQRNENTNANRERLSDDDESGG